MKKELTCKQCNKVFYRYPGDIKSLIVYCSNPCKYTASNRIPIVTKKCAFCSSIIKRKENAIFSKNIFCNAKCNSNYQVKVEGALPPSQTGKKQSIENKEKAKQRWTGSNNPNWVEDKTKLKRYEGSEEKRSPMYKNWRRGVCNRDKWACRIADNNCDNRIEVHHILSWRDFVELRYEINNGITLCHAHHPRARAEEKRLIPTFMELVSVSI